MKFYPLVLLALLTAACSTTKESGVKDTSTPTLADDGTRLATRTIYYNIKGIPVGLEREFRRQFEERMLGKNCHTPADFGTSMTANNCARFVPHHEKSVLVWDKDHAKKDLLLWINVSRTSDKLAYRLKFECSDGKKIIGCFNPGKFEMVYNPKDTDAAQAKLILDRLFRNHLILGMK